MSTLHQTIRDIDADIEAADRLKDDAENYVLRAKAAGYDLLLQSLAITRRVAQHARNCLSVNLKGDPRTPDPAPVFSDAALAAMEAYVASTTAPAHDPLAPVEAAPATALTPDTTPDPLDVPKPRRGGRRSRSSEGSPQPATEAGAQPVADAQPVPDDLDLPGEVAPEAAPAVEAAPAAAPEAAPAASTLDDIFGAPASDYDPLDT